MEESDRKLLYSVGYRELFPDDLRRSLYSCEKCMEEAGGIARSAWEYDKGGFWRTKG